MIVVRETSGPLTGLVKKIDQKLETAAGKTPRALGAYVMYGGKADGLEKQLRGLAETEVLKRVALCIGSVPDDYDVNKDANMTVVIYNVGRRPQQKVTANFAFRKGEFNDAKADAVVKALSDVLPK